MLEELLARDGVHRKTLTVTPEMTDQNGFITLLDLASNMQEGAGDQLTDLGIGFDVTSKMGLLWVVVWSEFTFIRIPKCGERITFYTYPGKKTHWFYPRRFYVFDEAGCELVHATYFWMLMNKDTRKVAEHDEILNAIPSVRIDGECKNPVMKMSFPDALSGKCERTVAKDEIDGNMHLNNAHYLDWIADIARGESLPMDRIGKLWINYKKEILPGETATLSYEKISDRLYVAGGLGADNRFIAKVDFILDK